ncbi:MAG TPA: amino acid permease [Cytophagales bacterium]|jgi:APA family basic amino acid/polyamine antiporter
MAVSSKTQGTLIRSLGLFSAFMLIVSSIIGSGVFKKVAPMAAELQSPGLVLLCWGLAGLITLCGALSNAEVAGMIADSGGQYVYFRKMYGSLFAYLYGWSCFAVIQSSAAASISYVFAQSFHSLVPLPNLPPELAQWSIGGVFTPFDNFGVKLLAIGLIWTLTAVNYRGVRYGGGLSNLVTVAVVVCIFTVVLLGLSIGGGQWSHIETPAAGYVSRSWTDAGLVGSIFGALLSAFWAYEGWNSLSFIGGEIKSPHRNIPLALIFGVLFVMTVYLLVNFTYLYVMPIDELIGVHQAKNTIAAVAVVKRFMGEGGALFISVLILVATFGCTNTTLLMASRIYYAMARNGLFFRTAAYCHPGYNTPSNALLLQAFWASMLILSGSFDQLTDMLIFASFIYYGSTAFGVFVLRRKMPDAPRPYRVIGYPVVPALFVLFCASLVIITLYNRPREAFMGLALILAGLPFYFYWKRVNRVDREVSV